VVRGILHTLPALGLALLCSGCATLPSGRGWGADSTARPGWPHVRRAAVEAATDPWVWAPLAGAAVLQIDDLDRRASDWARDNTPVFGSQENAERWSDDLRATCAVLEVGTFLATPSGNAPREWIVNKAKGAAVEVSAIAATGLTTGLLKQSAGRTRPNGTDDESFPSGHASGASVNCRLARINLDSIELGRGARLAADIGIHASVIGTAWARVEAGMHYPSDVLAGIALGNFFARFMTEAFLDARSREFIAVTPGDGGVLLSWGVRF
jgi:membrane-associated phospholipid phosphatase